MLQQGNGVLPSHRSEDQPPNRRHLDEKPSKSPTRLGEEAKKLGSPTLTVGETEVTITSGTISPNPVAPGAATTVTGGGQFRQRMAGGGICKLALGYRNSAGAWVGGNPVIAYSGMPGSTFVDWSSGSKTIAAPSAPGTYWLWVLAIDTTSDSEVIHAFKARVSTVEDKVNKKLASPILEVIDSRITITTIRILVPQHQLVA